MKFLVIFALFLVFLGTILPNMVSYGSIDMNSIFQLKPNVDISTPQGYDIQIINITDSRCPSDVTCVWAGQVNVTLQVQNNNSKTILSLVDPSKNSITLDKYTIKLANVEPHPTSGKKISLSDYVVTIKINSISDKIPLVSDSKKCLAGVDTCVMAHKLHLAPIKQLKVGIGALDVTCKDGYNLVLKATDNKPACVKSSTFDMLILRGWALGHEEFLKLKMTYELNSTK